MGVPGVSVIVSVLNGARFLPHISDCLKSQGYSDYEAVFVVSSKCSDDTLEVAKGLSEGDARFRTVEYLDTGALGGSKNRGIDEAKGRFLWFLDVDDTPSEDFLGKMTSIMEEHGADIAGCNYIICSDDRPFREVPGDYGVRTMTSEEALMARAEERYPVTSWSMLYDRGFVEREGLRFPEGLHEDIEFTYRALAAAEKVCFYDRPLYGYYINPGSVCRNASDRDLRARTEVEIYRRLEERLSGQGASRALLDRMALTRVRSAGHMTAEGFRRYARSEEFLRDAPKSKRMDWRLEVWSMRHLPSLYHCAMQAYFKLLWNRPGTVFSDRGGHRPGVGAPGRPSVSCRSTRWTASRPASRPSPRGSRTLSPGL